MRVLITGAARDLGNAVARQLESASEVDSIVGIDLLEGVTRGVKLEMLRADTRHRSITGLVEDIAADVVIHCAVQAGSGSTSVREAHETNVIGTQNVLAGCGAGTQRVIVKSGVAIYGHASGQPSLLGERAAGRPAPRTPAGRDLREVEQLALDHQLANPGCVHTSLRLGNVLSTTWHTALAGYLALSPVPTVLGYDPRIQLLAGADATDAVCRAALADHRGVFNVAADGVIPLSQLIRMAGGTGAATLPPLGGSWLQRQALKALSGFNAPLSLVELISSGVVVDCSALRAEFRWHPPHSSRGVAEDWIAARASHRVAVRAGLDS